MDDPEVPEIPGRRTEKTPRRLRKGMYILPSLFTTANIAFGYYAILQITNASVADARAPIVSEPAKPFTLPLASAAMIPGIPLAARLWLAISTSSPARRRCLP